MKQQDDKLYNRAFITWLLFIPLVMLNGAIREMVYKPYTGELTAHQISTVIASVAFLILAYFRLKNSLTSVSTGKLLLVGLMWVAMTIVFEIGLGHFIIGASWDKLFHDYDILAGRIWILLLLTLFCTPALIKKLASTTNPHQYQYSK